MTLNEELVLFSAFRYALGRRTYVVDAVVSEIERHWDEFGPNIREFYKNEIHEHLERFGNLGDACDEASWRRILKL